MRLRLGILFNYQASWMGGILYILNIMKLLNYLDDQKRPTIILFYNHNLFDFAKDIEYPYLTKVEWHFPPILNGYLISWLKNENVFIREILTQYKLDVLFPVQDFPVQVKTNIKLIAWYADLQHKYFPKNFTTLQLLKRHIRLKFIIRNTHDLILSSQSVANDFNRFFRIKKGMKLHIFHFVSLIDNLSTISIEELRSKYNLPKEYFMVSNQFHRHKNHKVLLLSLALLKKRGRNIKVVMTGRLPNTRKSKYIQEINTLIKEYSLQSHIRFLGVISREEQLQIMKHSKAVIQPSLFEGWSTVIEDAISLQVPVVASSLPVNIEQLGSAGKYFAPNDYLHLAEILSDFPDRDVNDIFYADYHLRVINAAENLLSILS